jgi:HEPN domain-containing protein
VGPRVTFRAEKPTATMSSSSEAAEERKLKSVERRYQKGGYTVTRPRRQGDQPTFLGSYVPDLIATSDSDHVIIEIKRSSAIRGSNELKEIAERVAQEPGWRFELIALPSRRPALQLNDVQRVANQARRAVAAGFSDLAYTYCWAAVELAVDVLAERYDVAHQTASVPELLRELTIQGAISRSESDAIAGARKLRNAVIHSAETPVVSPEEVEHLLALAERLGELARTAETGN